MVSAKDTQDSEMGDDEDSEVGSGESQRDQAIYALPASVHFKDSHPQSPYVDRLDKLTEVTMEDPSARSPRKFTSMRNDHMDLYSR